MWPHTLLSLSSDPLRSDLPVFSQENIWLDFSECRTPKLLGKSRTTTKHECYIQFSVITTYYINRRILELCKINGTINKKLLIKLVRAGVLKVCDTSTPCFCRSQKVQFCKLFQAPIRLYGDNRNLNSFPAPPHPQ
jgi:hypothetical protein